MACNIPAVSHVRNFGNVTYLSVVITRSVEAFVCISNAVRDHLVGRGVDATNCVVVPNAVDLQRFDEQHVQAVARASSSILRRGARLRL